MEVLDPRGGLHSLCAASRIQHSLGATTLRFATVVLLVGIVGSASGADRTPATGNEAEQQSGAAAVRPDAARAQPAPMRPLEKRMMRLKKKTDWWTHARKVLFSDLELTEEQEREVDSLVTAQLQARAEFLEGDARFKNARRHKTRPEIEAIRAELSEIKKRLRDRHEVFEDMRALLRDEQRPTFDMNRARLVAEDQNRVEPPESATPEGIPVSPRQSPSS